MATDESLVLKGQGNVDIQVGGPGNPWKYFSACASMSGPSVPLGDTEIRWCQDPNDANGFRISSKFRTAPDQITFDLMTKLGKIDHLAKLTCPYGLRARYAKTGTREDAANWNPLILAYCDVEMTEYSYDDLVVIDPNDQDEIMITVPNTASYESRIRKVQPSRVGTLASLGDAAINDVVFCGALDCELPGKKRLTPCSVWYGVTDADVSPYANPNLIKSVKDFIDDSFTYYLTPILGLNGNVEGVECAGDRVIVSSNADGAIAYNDTPTDQDTWNVVTVDTTNPPTANNNALFARTASEIWLACNNGYLYKSVDGGLTWDAKLAGTITTENLNAVFAYDGDLVYVVGDNGVILKSTNGGEGWTDITEVATTAANLLDVRVPPNRSQEVYIGTNDGQIFRSLDTGANFEAVSFSGDGVGTIDSLRFCGPCAGDTLWILQNDGGPRGRILRDLSGGAGGRDVEVVADYTAVIQAGIQLNALDCCNSNEVVVGGELNGGFPVLILTS